MIIRPDRLFPSLFKSATKGDEQIRLRLHRECFRFLRLSEIPEFAAALSLCALFIYFLDTSTGPLIWLATLTVCLILRGLAIRISDDDVAQNGHRKINRVALANLACGLLWGISIIVLVPENDVSLEAYTLLWLVGVSVASVATMAMSSWITLTHVAGVVACTVIRLAIDSNYLSMLVAIGLLILYSFLIAIAVAARRTMANEIQLQFTNAELVKEVESERSRIEALNRELNQEIDRRTILENELRRDRDYAQELSTVDSLTGIRNRRAFDKALSDEVSRAARSARPLSLILIDVDFFKSYNDHYGHQLGDDALQQVATVLEEYTRRSGDLCARYGGEEFAVLLPDTEMDNAATLAETLREAIQNREIPHAHSQAAEFLTISAGVATVLGDANAGAQLLNEADRALYAAKGGGRNNVMCAT